MTPQEYDALICLYYKIYYPLETMPLGVVSELALGQEFNTELQRETADTYRAVLEGMLAKGWLRVVKRSATERLGRLRAAGWIGPNPVWVPQKGDLDFTRKGFVLYRRASRARGTDSPESLVFADEERHVVHVVGSTKAHCREVFQRNFGSDVEGYSENVAAFVAKPVRVLRIEEPERVGRWLEREVNPHRGGWRIPVHYQPIRRCRVEIPELGVKGWRTTMNRTVIEGKVRLPGVTPAIHFELSDAFEQDGPGRVSYRPCLIVYDGETTPKTITTVYHGETVVAGGIGDGFTHFQWHGAESQPMPMTPEQALVALREGLNRFFAR